jgi:GMP synthase (glutamine-hydrolysing)
MAPILLLKVGGKKEQVIKSIGDYEMWFQRAAPEETLGLVDLQSKDPQWPDEYAGVIIMGSPHSVYEPLPWLPKALDAISELLDRKVPILGVCFGHQMLCTVMGGEVSASGKGYEAGTVQLQATPEGLADPLIGPLFDSGKMIVNESHGDTVIALPKGATVLAENQHDPHQALRLTENVWSVQFHPEIGLSEAHTILQDYRPKLEEKGHDVDALIANSAETPAARSLVRRFIEMVRDNNG